MKVPIPVGNEGARHWQVGSFQRQVAFSYVNFASKFLSICFKYLCKVIVRLFPEWWINQCTGKTCGRKKLAGWPHPGKNPWNPWISDTSLKTLKCPRISIVIFERSLKSPWILKMILEILEFWVWYDLAQTFWAHLCVCTVGSYASLSVSLSVRPSVTWPKFRLDHNTPYEEVRSPQ